MSATHEAQNSTPVLATLKRSGSPPPWLCKLHFRHGRTTIYAVEVTANGEIVRVGDRAVYAASDIGFFPSAIESIEPY